MPETAPKGKGIGGFLNQTTAGLPNWAWLLVIGAGLAAVYVVPKLFGSGKQTAPTTTATDPTSSDQGLGLAVDPTTGLPYAVSGLVPSGGTGGSNVDLSQTNNLLQQILTQQAQLNAAEGKTTTTPTQAPPRTQTTPPPDEETLERTTPPRQDIAARTPPRQDTAARTPPRQDTAARTPRPVTAPAQTPTPTPSMYITATQWPSELGTASGIASKYGISLQKFLQLNPSITNPDLIYAGQQYRVR